MSNPVETKNDAPRDVEPEVLFLSPFDICRSELNPRKTFSERPMEELISSVRKHGVLQSLGVRRLGDKDGDLFELIWGERRWRAATVVCNGDDGKEAVPDLRVPVMVRSMSDKEVFELQVEENLKRAPLLVTEEAQAYQTAIERFGLSQREVAAMFDRSQSRVAELLGLLDFPDAVLARLDLPSSEPEHLDLYKAVEASRVPTAIDGGQSRMRALAAAEEAPTIKAAREVVQERFLRPIREREDWNSRDFSEVGNEGVEVLSYEQSRQVFPHRVQSLTPVTEGGYVFAGDVPGSDMLADGADDSKTWGDWAEIYGVPWKLACDGTMRTVALVVRDAVAQSAVVAHQFLCRQEGTKLAVQGDYDLEGGARIMVWPSRQEDRLPMAMRGGRAMALSESEVYRISAGGTLRDEEGLVLELLPPEGEGDVPPFYGLDLGSCSFLPQFGRVGSPSSVVGVTESGSTEGSGPDLSYEELEARASKLSEMLSDLEEAVRSAGPGDERRDVFLARCGSDLVELAIAGFSENDNPYVLALLALDKPDPDGRVMAGWEGFETSRAGYESATVCAWVLYWMNLHEGEDLESCRAWQLALEVYG